MKPPRHVLPLLILGLFSSWLGAGEPRDERPNLVFLLWEDRLLDDLDSAEHLSVPHLDGLMESGRRFEAHVPSSRGRPARTMWASGLWPHESGSYFIDGPRTLPAGKTVPILLKRSGYALALVGSFPEGDARPYGFDGRMPATSARVRDGLPAFLAENADAPLFLWWAPDVEVGRQDVTVDPTVGEPPAWFDGDAEEWAFAVAKRHERARRLDEHLGELLAILDQAGRTENTVFILVGDQADRKLPAECASERFLTTPLVFAGRGVGEPGKVPGVVTTLDLARTLLDLGGTEPVQAMRGSSLRPAIEGAPVPADTLFGALYEPRVSPASRAGKLPHKDVKVLYSRGPRWKYVFYVQDIGRSGTGNREVQLDHAAGTQSLFDLEQDPDELHDLAPDAAQAARCAALREELFAWWRGTGGGDFPVPFLSPPLGPAPKDRPNIVLIISDDHDYEHLGFLGNPSVHTPTLDSLAESGIVFPVGYVTMSRCRPSLGSLLSGQYPHQHGIHDNQSQQLLAREGSLPNQLKEAGYPTFCAGKFWEGSYESMGFMGSVDSVSFVRSDQQEDLFAFVDQYREERPFFVWYAPLLPHGPFTPPKRHRERFVDTPVELPAWVSGPAERFIEAERTSYAMEAWLDEGLGAFVERLKEVGEFDDTLFLFLIDNGWANGHPGKGSVFEKGLRTPVFVSWAKGLAGGRRNLSLVSSLDLYATILDYAGAEIPDACAGLSLRPQLEKGAAGPREILYGAAYDHETVRRKVGVEHFVYALYARTATHKFVLYLQDVQDPDEFVIWHEYAEFPARRRGDRNLYDLRVDPYERHDLSKDPEQAALMAELEAGCLAWWKETGGKPLDVPE